MGIFDGTLVDIRVHCHRDQARSVSRLSTVLHWHSGVSGHPGNRVDTAHCFQRSWLPSWPLSLKQEWELVSIPLWQAGRDVWYHWTLAEREGHTPRSPYSWSKNKRQPSVDLQVRLLSAKHAHSTPFDKDIRAPPIYVFGQTGLNFNWKSEDHTPNAL